MSPVNNKLCENQVFSPEVQFGCPGMTVPQNSPADPVRKFHHHPLLQEV